MTELDEQKSILQIVCNGEKRASWYRDGFVAFIEKYVLHNAVPTGCQA